MFVTLPQYISRSVFVSVRWALVSLSASLYLSVSKSDSVCRWRCESICPSASLLASRLHICCRSQNTESRNEIFKLPDNGINSFYGLTEKSASFLGFTEQISSFLGSRRGSIYRILGRNLAYSRILGWKYGNSRVPGIPSPFVSFLWLCRRFPAELYGWIYAQHHETEAQPKPDTASASFTFHYFRKFFTFSTAQLRLIIAAEIILLKI